MTRDSPTGQRRVKHPRTFVQLVRSGMTCAATRLDTRHVSIEKASIVIAAERTARRQLRGDRPRLAHVEGAARAAAHVSHGLDDGAASAVVAAAWLHDIGYAPALVRTGFHPLDGALHLASVGWPDDVVRLVAHHSYAAIVAPYFGVADHLTVLDPVGGRAADILTFADIVSGADGRGTTIQRRIEEMRQRHAEARSPVPREVREERYRLLQQTALRVLRSSPQARVSLTATSA